MARPATASGPARDDLDLADAELRQRDERGGGGRAGPDDPRAVDPADALVGQGRDDPADIGVEPARAVRTEQQRVDGAGQLGAAPARARRVEGRRSSAAS